MLVLYAGVDLTFVFQFNFNRVILSGCSRISFLLVQGMRGKFCAADRLQRNHQKKDKIFRGYSYKIKTKSQLGLGENGNSAAIREQKTHFYN